MSGRSFHFDARGVRCLPEEKYTLEILTASLGKYHILSPEKELELVLDAQKGSESARDALVKHNLRFVVSVARFYWNKKFTLNDLIAEGVLGLIKAIETYQPTYSTRFLSYAVWWIRKYIKEYCMRYGFPVKIPFSMQTSTEGGENGKIPINGSTKHMLPEKVNFSQIEGENPEELFSYPNANYEDTINDMHKRDIEKLIKINFTEEEQKALLFYIEMNSNGKLSLTAVAKIFNCNYMEFKNKIRKLIQTTCLNTGYPP